MKEIEALIRQAQEWRFTSNQIERLGACIRLHALLDAYRALGADDRPWRKECGTLR